MFIYKRYCCLLMIGLYGSDFETRDGIYPFLEQIPEPGNVFIYYLSPLNLLLIIP